MLLRSRRFLTRTVALATLGPLACLPLVMTAAAAAPGVPPVSTASQPAPASLGKAAEIFSTYTWGSVSFDTLQTNGLPFKVEATALALYFNAREGLSLNYASLEKILTRFGFIYPDAIANWPEADLSQFREKPLGLVHGMVHPAFTPVKVEVAEQGCAACHGGILYDKDGMPTKTVYLGIPNTSLNIEGYTATVYASLKYAAERPLEFFAALHQVFPDLSLEEDATLKLIVWPLTSKRILDLALSDDRATPELAGAPGLTNGIGSLKDVYHLLPHDHAVPRDGFTSIPVAGDRQFRSSLLYDGTYTPPGDERFRPFTAAEAQDPDHINKLAGVVAFFTVPTLGTKSTVAEAEIPQVETVMHGLATSWEPPTFPGQVDATLAATGSAVYTANCASCHGTYTLKAGKLRLNTFPNVAMSLAAVQTDPLRTESITPDLVAALKADAAYMRHIDVANTGVYVAVPLTSLWLSAPYLHNGSVPTLWHLMHPSERPQQFWVGGHKLDYTKVGIAGSPGADGVYNYPLNYVPWSTPILYDTTVSGQSNQGHEFPFDQMSEADKAALLEFLKLI